MSLNAIMDSLDSIPEQYRDLYTEKNGKYELTGIGGVKTPADVQRVQQALDHEKANHTATKEKFQPWAEMKHDEVMSQLDRIPELEAAAQGKLDEAAIEEMVTRRVDGTIKSKTSPLERQVSQLTKERDDIAKERDALASEKRQRTIHDAVGLQLRDAKVIEHARDDALMIAERIFDIQEDGTIVTKDNVGVTPGISPKDWISEIQAGGKKPHWWGPTVGGGANPGGTGGAGGANPWTAESWNMTKQGQIIREKGMEHAKRLAEAAGTTVGGMKPKPKK